MLDLDHFKAVNDTLGHPAGDKLLKMVTERLRALVRETDTVARMGGDEFAIVQVAIAQPADATTLAQRIIEVVSKPYDIEGHQVVIGATHRHRHGAGRRPDPRRADPQRGPGALPRQGRRARHLLLLRAGDGCADAGPPRHGVRHAPGTDGGRVRAALSAGRQSREQRDHAASRRSSAGAIPRTAWCRPSTFIPLAEKIGCHRRAGRMGDPRCLRDGGDMAQAT